MNNQIILENEYQKWVNFRQAIISLLTQRKITHDDMMRILGDRMNMGQGDFYYKGKII